MEKIIFSKKAEDETYHSEWLSFFECIKRNRKPLVTIEDGLNVMKVIESAKLANNNKPLKLDIAKLKEKNDVIKFEVEKDLKNQDNTVRLGAATLNEIFKAADYDLDIVRNTKKVKPI